MKNKVEGLNNVDDNWLIRSAGIGALIGRPIHTTMANLLSDHGIESKGHTAKQLTYEQLQSSDLILAMEVSHKKEIVRNYPTVSGKCFLLSHWVGKYDITDPYRKDTDSFKEAYNRIDDGVNGWLKILTKQNIGH